MQAIFSVDNLVQNLLSLFSFSQLGVNSLDIIMILVILFYSYEGYILGFLLAFLDFASFVFSFILGLLFFASVAKILVMLFSIPQGFANAIGFFLVALVSEIVITFLLRHLLRRLVRFFNDHPLPKFLVSLNHPLGILPGLASSYVILSFILTVIIALPTSPILKELVSQSRFGSSLVGHTVSMQNSLNDIFGGAVADTLNVMTVKPESDQTIKLHFTVANPTVDEEAESQMLTLINRERAKEGLAQLRPTAKLVILARSYSTDMFKRGYFSHYNPEGLSPFDRMTNSEIEYVHAGENLALAPSTELAHQGLMNSPGHRANILSPDYRHVGIGVMDGGIYGKMFVQEFTE